MLWKVVCISNVQLHKYPIINFSCKNAPIKSNWWTLDLCLTESAKKYFKVRMEAVGDQVSPTSSSFCRSPLTIIINFSLSTPPSDWILAF